MDMKNSTRIASRFASYTRLSLQWWVCTFWTFLYFLYFCTFVLLQFILFPLFEFEFSFLYWTSFFYFLFVLYIFSSLEFGTFEFFDLFFVLFLFVYFLLIFCIFLLFCLDFRCACKLNNNFRHNTHKSHQVNSFSGLLSVLCFFSVFFSDFSRRTTLSSVLILIFTAFALVVYDCVYVLFCLYVFLFYCLFVYDFVFDCNAFCLIVCFFVMLVFFFENLATNKCTHITSNPITNSRPTAMKSCRLLVSFAFLIFVFLYYYIFELSWVDFLHLNADHFFIFCCNFCCVFVFVLLFRLHFLNAWSWSFFFFFLRFFFFFFFACTHTQ